MHDAVIVGSGPNSASPHHEPGSRRIGLGEAVVCDFGGTMRGYCSDITRTVFTGEPPSELRNLYGVLQEAQEKAVAAAVVGTPCEDVDATARRIIEEGGYGPFFIHRTGHGIGLEVHEPPSLSQSRGKDVLRIVGDPVENVGGAFGMGPGTAALAR